MLFPVYFSIPWPPSLLLCRVCLRPYHSATAQVVPGDRDFLQGELSYWDLERFQFPPFIPATCQAADLVQWLQWPQVELCRGQQILDSDNVCMPLSQILGILHGTRLHHAAFFAISLTFLLFSQETIYDRRLKLSLFEFCFILRIFPGDSME